MIEIEIQGIERLGEAFASMADHVRDFRPRIWPPVNARFTEIMIEQFDSEGASGDSGPWLPLSPNYEVWKEKNYPGQPILELTGNLRRSFMGPFNPNAHYVETPDLLERGSTVPYAAYHQTGTSRMTARPPIDLTPAQAESLRDAAMGAFSEIGIELGFEVTLG